MSVNISTHTTSILNTSHIKTLPITAADISVATKQDKVLAKVYRYTKTSWPTTVKAALKPYLHRQHQLTVEGDGLLWGI